MFEPEPEKIKINGEEKEFVPIDYLHFPMFPVEYVSTDKTLYLLYIDENDDGSWWYVVKTNPETIRKYLKGELCAREVIDTGTTYVGYWNWDKNEIENLEPLEKKLKDGFLTEDDLPRYL